MHKDLENLDGQAVAPESPQQELSIGEVTETAQLISDTDPNH